MLAVRARARCHSHPERDRVGRVRRDGRHPRKHQRRKRNETPPARDRIERSAKHPGDEKKNVGVQIQITDVSQLGMKTFRTANTGAIWSPHWHGRAPIPRYWWKTFLIIPPQPPSDTRPTS